MLTKKIREFFEENGVTLNKEFEEKYEKNENHMLQNERQLIGIWRMCKFWKSFIMEEDLPNLIIHQLLTFDRIHCSVIGSTAEQNAYIGNYARVICELPLHYVTQCNSYGNVSIVRGFGSCRETL